MPLLLLFKLQALCPGCQFDETADLNTDFCQYNASLWKRSILETVLLFTNLAPVIIRFEEEFRRRLKMFKILGRLSQVSHSNILDINTAPRGFLKSSSIPPALPPPSHNASSPYSVPVRFVWRWSRTPWPPGGGAYSPTACAVSWSVFLAGRCPQAAPWDFCVPRSSPWSAPWVFPRTPRGCGRRRCGNVASHQAI